MDQFVTTASDVTSQLFGPDSGVPWWAWAVVVGAIMWKMLLPERRTAQERDTAMAAAMAGNGEGGKKGKKNKKPKK